MSNQNKISPYNTSGQNSIISLMEIKPIKLSLR